MGGTVPMILMRTDIGCSDSQIYDRDTHWDPSVKTFFLNEIEPSSTTYFVRHLKFDCIPMYAKLYVEKAREIYKAMKREQIQKVPTPARSTPVKMKAKLPVSTPVKAKTKPAVSTKVLKTGKLKAKK